MTAFTRFSGLSSKISEVLLLLGENHLSELFMDKLRDTLSTKPMRYLEVQHDMVMMMLQSKNSQMRNLLTDSHWLRELLRLLLLYLGKRSEKRNLR